MNKIQNFIFSVLPAVIVSTMPCYSGCANTMDIGAYLECADSGQVYPTDEQIEMLKPFMPDSAYRPAPSISDRVFWETIATKESAQEILATAIEDLEKKPEVPISDAIYRRANQEGNRGIYKPRYYRSMERLENATIAECLENQGRFLPQIKEHIAAIMEMKSWLHPNHDDGKNSVLEGKRVAIDLGARKFGSVIILADMLLEDALPSEMRAEIKDQIQWRMTDSYLKSCRGEDKKGNSWIYGHSNWNSVCTGGTLFSSLSASNDPDERLAVLGSAINSMKYYLSGFGADGYCSEGVGYWNYGFGNYLYLAQLVYDYTDGGIDLFSFEDPEKMRRVGNFPEAFEIQKQIYPCFSDGSSTIKEGNDNFAYLLSAKYYGANKPTYSRPDDVVQRLMEWSDPVSYVATERASKALPSHTYYDDYGIIISRGQQEVPFSIAIKAGHNDENHNHSDVGSYLIVLDRNYLICGDIGAPSYRAGSFSPRNKARSSWGHPVPRINGELQSNGREFSGEVIETSFTEGADSAVIDLKPAYEVAGLSTLVRTMKNDKSGTGTITITDQFTASKSIDFGTAIMTFGEHTIVDSNTVLLKHNGQILKAKISSEGGAIKILGEKVPVEHLRNGPEAFRIGIDFEEKQQSGSITIVYTPVL